jgi:hypothetical protein
MVRKYALKLPVKCVSIFYLLDLMLSIMVRDITFVPVSIVSSESCFSLTGRIIEEWRRRLLPETVEMLACIKD